MRCFLFPPYFLSLFLLVVYCVASVSWWVVLGSDAGALFLFYVPGFLVLLLLLFAFWIVEGFVLECGIVVLRHFLFFSLSFVFGSF